jgi:uncharacterized SAM-dependent methyltransferase
LIGIDLVKEAGILHAAYDDEIGLTAAFNLNLLQHLNRMLNADFNARDWQHRCRFDPVESRVEMHLEARHPVTVNWSGGQRCFQQGESIHTENSYKYTQEKFLQLLEWAGFVQVRTWTDPSNWFMVCHARAG